MNESTHNTTIHLLRLILALTTEERHSTNDKSMCHYIQCTLPDYEQDRRNASCHAIPVPSTIFEENQTDSLSLMKLEKYIHLYVYPVFIFMGIFGNKLSCFIMFINSRRNGYPASLYLTLLAFVDCLFLLGSALPDWISQIHHKLDVKIISDLSCRFVYWFGNFTTHLSAGLVVSVTVERFIAVQYPLIAHKINTVTRTRLVLLILIMFFFLLDSPLLLFNKLSTENFFVVYFCPNDTDIRYERPSHIRCGSANKSFEEKWVYIDFAVYTFIPFCIIVTLNCLIIRRLIDAQRFRQRMFRFNNYTPRQCSADSRSRYDSDSFPSLEMTEQQNRHVRRFQSISEKKPLVILLQPQLSISEERYRRCSSKLSTTSTELSSLSFDARTRSQRQCQISTRRHKSISSSNSNNTRLTILLLFVSFSFLILTLPAVLLNLMISTILQSKSPTVNSIVNNNNSSDTAFYYTIARLLMIINHSINFILYFVLGKRFRHDLKHFFVGYWRKFYAS